jgi:hypothetical protein
MNVFFRLLKASMYLKINAKQNQGNCQNPQQNVTQQKDFETYLIPNQEENNSKLTSSAFLKHHFGKKNIFYCPL